MNLCIQCNNKVGVEKKVNNEGIIFCSSDCYDDYNNSPNDHSHPYIDDYDAIRFEYINWIKNYEEKLYHYWLYGAPRVEDLIESINAIIDEFYDYKRLEGSDGVFSLEIFNYLVSFEELKNTILNWEVDGEELQKRRALIKRKREAQNL